MRFGLHIGGNFGDHSADKRIGGSVLCVAGDFGHRHSGLFSLVLSIIPPEMAARCCAQRIFTNYFRLAITDKYSSSIAFISKATRRLSWASSSVSLSASSIFSIVRLFTGTG